MTSFMLKLIGIICMLLDHTSNTFINGFSFLNLIGRLAFPLFAFQIVIGYYNTKNLKKYITRLFIFALISQPIFMLFLSTYTKIFTLNIFFTFLLGILAIYIYDNFKEKKYGKIIGIITLLLISTISQIIKVDYGAFGTILIFTFYLFKDSKILLLFSMYILCFLRYLIYTLINPTLNFYYLLINFFTFLSIFLILIFNGKQGKKTKYFFYIFYPLHLTIIYILKMVLIN